MKHGSDTLIKVAIAVIVFAIAVQMAWAIIQPLLPFVIGFVALVLGIGIARSIRRNMHGGHGKKSLTRGGN